MPAQHAASLPLVSVIVPAYNCARHVAESLQSILDQDYPNTELIVVDDGSTDETVSVVSRLGSRVALLQQANRGAAAARNLGARHARGEFLAFLDADDVWLPGKLSAQVTHALAHPDVGIVYSRWAEWSPGTDGSYPDPLEFATHSPPGGIDEDRSGWVYPDLLFSCIVCTITVLMRRNLFEKLSGFDESIRVGEDYDLWLRASRVTQVHKLASNFALYRMWPGNTTRKVPSSNHEFHVVSRAIERYGLAGPDGRSADANDVRARLARTWLLYGHAHLTAGDPREAAAAFRQAARLAGWNAQLAYYVLVAILRSRFFGMRANG